MRMRACKQWAGHTTMPTNLQYNVPLCIGTPLTAPPRASCPLPPPDARLLTATIDLGIA